MLITAHHFLINIWSNAGQATEYMYMGDMGRTIATDSHAVIQR